MCSSDLSLSLGTPVIASENGSRPANVITYREDDAESLCLKLMALTQNYSQAKDLTRLDEVNDNILRTADWLLDEGSGDAKEKELRRDFASAD